MDTIIAAPTSCKVRAVIRFLHAERQSVAEIHHRLCHVYGDNEWQLCERMVQKIEGWAHWYACRRWSRM